MSKRTPKFLDERKKATFPPGLHDHHPTVGLIQVTYHYIDLSDKVRISSTERGDKITRQEEEEIRKTHSWTYRD